MEMQKLFTWKYLQLTEIAATQTLFFQAGAIDFQPQNRDFFLLYRSENTQQKGVQYHSKKIVYGAAHYYLFDHLQIGKRVPQLQVYPTYFQYQKTYYHICILEVNTDTIKVQKAIIWLLQQTFITLRCSVAEVDARAFMQKVELLFKVAKSSKHPTTLYKNILHTHYEQNLEDFVIAAIEEQKSFVQVQIVLQLQSNSFIELRRKMQEVRKTLTRFNITTDRLFCEQLKGIELLYLQKTKPHVRADAAFVQADKVTALFPIATLGLYDKQGTHIGRDMYQNPVFLDIWYRGQQRVNSNFIILGQSGQGKSSLLKTILTTHDTVQQFIIDPEDEYVFDHIAETAYERIEISADCLIATLFDFTDMTDDQLHFLVEHFTYRVDASYAEQQVYRQLLLQFSAEDAGTLTEFYAFSRKKMSLEKIQLYVQELLQRRLVTTQTNKRIVHYVLVGILEQTSKQAKLVLYELLASIWLEIQQHVASRKLLVMDEAYVFFQKDMPLVTEILRNIFKRIRKYNSAIGLISQNIADFMEPSQQYALMTIFDNATYKFIFYQGAEDMQHLQRLQKIAEKDMIQFQTLTLGTCIICIGNLLGKLWVRYVQ